MKVWITKYALTSGMQEEVDAEICSECMGMIKVPQNKISQYFHGEGKEWHRTRESAIKRAQAMREKKIASLKKQIKKMEEMTW